VTLSAIDVLAALPLGRGVKLIAKDENGLAALDKPEGVLSHPNSDRDQGRALIHAAYNENAECYEWVAEGGQKGRLWLINRLDSATSGLILAAASEEVAREVRSQFKGRKVRKLYKAIVFGRPKLPSEEWRDLLGVTKRAGTVRAAAGGGNLPAGCHMSVERSWAGAARLSLLSLEPHTGRSHQLRVQCSKRGLPIVGDRTYGNFASNRLVAKAGMPKRMFLHSLSVSLSYSIRGKTFDFSATSPLPGEFALLG
jgi:23S rRNA pseudouridine955/2504/2580 synthase